MVILLKYFDSCNMQMTLDIPVFLFFLVATSNDLWLLSVLFAILTAKLRGGYLSVGVYQQSES